MQHAAATVYLRGPAAEQAATGFLAEGVLATSTISGPDTFVGDFKNHIAKSPAANDEIVASRMGTPAVQGLTTIGRPAVVPTPANT